MKHLSKKKSIIITALAIIYVFFMVLALVYVFKAPFFSQKTELYISDKDTVASYQTILAPHASSIHLRLFSLICIFRGNQIKRTGYYSFTNESTIQVYRKLTRGKQDPIYFSFNSMRTLQQLAGKIDNGLMIDSVEFMSKINDSLYLIKLGFNRRTIPSLFIPNKYELYWDISVDDFFMKMKKEHDRFWNNERRTLLKKTNLSEYEVSTLASIVEEESNDYEDRRIIAGLYLNRIRIGMPMQACPTVRYANNDYTITRVYNHHTLIESPYNTYLNKGLPPGPIRIPSIKAIDAVLHYMPNNYLYMCAKEDFSGKHRFASTYNEHLRNARLYQQAYEKKYRK